MRLVFDRGTVVLRDVPHGLDPVGIPGLLWDPRVGAWRAPARLAYPLASALGRRDVQLADSPRPALGPPSGFRAPPLRPYQQQALDTWRLAGRRGIVVLPTGAGKTRVALAAMAAVRAGILCLVPTRALVAQWCAALAEVYDGPIGRFAEGERRLAPVTVATFASAYRHMATLGDRFGLLVVDEVHHFGHGALDETLEMAIAPLRLGLTATAPPDDALARLRTLVGPVVVELGVADLAGEFLAPLDRFVLPLALSPDEQKAYDDLVVVYRRAWDELRGTMPRATFEDFLRHGAQTDEGRRGIAAWRRARRLLAYPACKREALAHLLERHRESRTLVFVADNETAYTVARDFLVMPLTCEIGSRERQDVLERFREGRLRTLVSAQVLNEGIDVPDAEVGIVVGARLGDREHVQRVGRLLRPRPGKRATLYELVIRGSSEVGRAERRWRRVAARE